MDWTQERTLQFIKACLKKGLPQTADKVDWTSLATEFLITENQIKTKWANIMSRYEMEKLLGNLRSYPSKIWGTKFLGELVWMAVIELWVQKC
jgi:hypothetical protein